MCYLCDNSLNQNDLDQIVYLDCSDCDQVRTLPENLPNLKFLSIYNTNIEEIPSYELLESLYCFNTPVKELPSLPKLRKLLAQYSKIAYIPEDYYRVEVVNINDTNVRVVPDSMISLRWLSAKNTLVSDISSKLISLEWLSIENTQVREMPSRMISLQYLNCSGTMISEINTHTYPMLRKLECRGCSIDPFSFTNGLDVMG